VHAISGVIVLTHLLRDKYTISVSLNFLFHGGQFNQVLIPFAVFIVFFNDAFVVVVVQIAEKAPKLGFPADARHNSPINELLLLFSNLLLTLATPLAHLIKVSVLPNVHQFRLPFQLLDIIISCCRAHLRPRLRLGSFVFSPVFLGDFRSLPLEVHKLLVFPFLPLGSLLVHFSLVVHCQFNSVFRGNLDVEVLILLIFPFLPDLFLRTVILLNRFHNHLQGIANSSLYNFVVVKARLFSLGNLLVVTGREVAQEVEFEMTVHLLKLFLELLPFPLLQVRLVLLYRLVNLLLDGSLDRTKDASKLVFPRLASLYFLVTTAFVILT